MNVKNACTVVLLGFVATSVVVLVVKSLRQTEPATDVEQGDRLIVCYFHGARCSACEKIEKYAREAVVGGFAAEIGSGRIVWKAIDFDRLENRQLAEDFGVVTSSLVLVEVRGGVRKQWKSLPEVWELIDDKPAFVALVRREVQALLKAK
jgi:hypothetical protein